jgi:hypothetical protein
MKYILFLGILVYQISLSETANCSSSLADTACITIIPGIYEKAFPNPLKGFRSSSTEAEDYPTLTRLYVKWNEIENSEEDGVEKILDYCNRQWMDLPRRNVKVIPRVYLEWPYSKQNSENSRDTVTTIWGDTRYVDRFWPADMQQGDYSSEKFIKRLVNLILKMGQAWDNDPRVAYIEMGLIGWWGEQHTPYISDEQQNLIGDAFTSAFKTKLIMVRQVKDFKSFPFGSYWDSFAHASQQDEATGLVACGDKWRTTVRGGEVAYDWGDLSRTGLNPDESLGNRSCRDYLIDYVREVHCNHLGWINHYNSEDTMIRKGAEEFQKNLGYRFVIDAVKYTPNVMSGDSLTMNFSVRNVGSSPFYYNWPVEVSLLDPMTKQPVWKTTFRNVDIRTWLPGDMWDKTKKMYKIEPDKNQIYGKFLLPPDLPMGEFILALSILDPSGNVPAVRFAIKNYFIGGRHPIGKIGINKYIENPELDITVFDDLYSDRSLYYEYKRQSETCR